MLSDEAEKADNLIHIYHKSLLYLVSNAFETIAPAHIAGMQIYSGELQLKSSVAVYVAPKSDQTKATSHGGFGNDPTTLNHTLSRITGKPVTSLAQTGFSANQLDF